MECQAILESLVKAFSAASGPAQIRKVPIGWILPQKFVELLADPKSFVQESASCGRWKRLVTGYLKQLAFYCVCNSRQISG